MCGILGGWFLNLEKKDLYKINLAIALMKNRGPNDQSYQTISHNNSHVVLGHTRLSIIDLSNAGHQPMYSDDGQFAIVFNGEIYNYKELRYELMQIGYTFYSKSDTEVLLKAWIQWGRASLARLSGMFAFVIYDKSKNLLTCVRDAFGIKPFFYYINKNYFIFASTIQALLKMKRDNPQINIQRCYDYLVHADYDSQEESFIEGIKHLMPGQLITFDCTNNILSSPINWLNHSINPEYNSLSFSSATEAVRALFLKNIALHLRSDVPLGAALSGGIDSSAVVCAMRYVEPDIPIHTFSFIADHAVLSEEKWIDTINKHTRSIPHKVFATAQDLSNDLDDMINAQGEPFGSTSIYAQYRVFKLAKEHGIIVTLDGQGADELLAGYQGYPTQRINSLWEQRKIIQIAQFIHQWQKWPGRGYKKGLLHLVQAVAPNYLIKYFHSIKTTPNWVNKDFVDAAGINKKLNLFEKENSYKENRVIEKLLYSIKQKGLPELLRHGDRNSMHFSIESRVPFLTLPLAELLLSLPEHYLISNSGETKSIFREAMRGIVPEHVLNRRDKIGFSTPEKDWLITLAPTIRNWLSESQDIPLFRSKILMNNFEAIISGNKPFSWQLWRWINFTRWHRNIIQNNT